VPEAPRSDKEKAWAALSANALLLPGSGSLYLGQRKSGWVQTVLALLGFAISMLWLGELVEQWWSDGVASLIPPPHLETGLLGFGLFGVAWVWSLLTAWDAVRRAGGRPGRLPPAP
jgi:hypothetical protein